MWKQLINRWSDWVGDRHLELAIHAELRRLGHPVHASKTRQFRLVAIERPGWRQVYRFYVEAPDHAGELIVLQGVARSDGRREGAEVLISPSLSTVRQQEQQWCSGLIRRRGAG